VMFVCISASISQELHLQASPNFLCMLFVAAVQSSFGDAATAYVLPVLWMTPCLPVIGRAIATQIGRLLKLIHQGAAPDRGQSLMTTTALSVVTVEMVKISPCITTINDIRWHVNFIQPCSLYLENKSSKSHLGRARRRYPSRQRMLSLNYRHSSGSSAPSGGVHQILSCL